MVKNNPEQFYDRLMNYYSKIGDVLRGEAEAASVFPNASDIGGSRERIYAEVLRLHLPSNCKVMFGGLLFSIDGYTSDQIDILINSQSALQFNFSSKDGSGKSLACIDGCVGVVSVKSRLNKGALEDALNNIASIPDKSPLTHERYNSEMRIQDYNDWPYKIIYASDGYINATSLVKNLNQFYAINSDIPINKRPNLIHIAGKCAAYRTMPGDTTIEGTKLEPNLYYELPSPDINALLMATIRIQYIATISVLIQFDYSDLANKVNSYLVRFGDHF